MIRQRRSEKNVEGMNKMLEGFRLELQDSNTLVLTHSEKLINMVYHRATREETTNEVEKSAPLAAKEAAENNRSRIEGYKKYARKMMDEAIEKAWGSCCI